MLASLSSLIHHETPVCQRKRKTRVTITLWGYSNHIYHQMRIIQEVIVEQSERLNEASCAEHV
jgi:hypothetical protein